MHPEFADWYRSAGISPPEGLLQKRWAGVVELSTTPSMDILLSLLRLYLLPPSGEDYCLPALREEFRKHDDTFPSASNAEEMRVLAGACLRQMFDQGTTHGLRAALGIAAAAFPSRKPYLPAVGHVEAAERHLTRAATEKRRRIQISSLPRPEPMTKEHFAEVYQPAVAANAVPATAEPLRALMNELVTATGRSLDAADASIASLSHAIAAKEEELDYLWWLTASHSCILKAQFKSVSRPVACIVFPVELADLTKLLPGPAFALPILFQALQCTSPEESTDPAPLSHAVNAAPRDWRHTASLTPGLDQAGILCPISYAIARSLDTDGADDWLPVYKKRCDVPPDIRVTPEALASQTYRERLFLRALKE